MNNNNNNQYVDRPNSGALFTRQKKSEKAPDMGGDLTIGDDVLAYIRQAGPGPIKLELSGWRRMDRSNKTFMSLQVQIPYELRGGQPRMGATSASVPAQQRPMQQQPQQNYAQASRGYQPPAVQQVDDLPPWEL